MDQNTSLQNTASKPSSNQTIKHILGAITVLVAAVASAIFLFSVQGWGDSFVNKYFDIRSDGSGALFAGVGYFLIWFPLNLLLWGLISIQLAKKVRSVWKAYLITFLILLGLNLLYIFGSFVVNYIKYSDELPAIRERKQQEKIVLNAKTVSDCALIPENYQWASCVMEGNKVRTETDLQNCLEEAKNRIIPHAPEASFDNCRYAYAVTNRKLNLCNLIQGQSACVYDLVWGTIRIPALEPSVVVEQCTTLKKESLRESCFIVILRKLERNDPLVNTVCQNIPTGKDFGKEDNHRIQEFCSRG